MSSFSRRAAFVVLVFTLSMRAFAAEAKEVDLRDATVVLPASNAPRLMAAANLLIDEVEKRTGIRWQLANGSLLGSSRPLIRVGWGLSADEKLPPEGFQIDTQQIPAGNTESNPIVVKIAGTDDRGTLFGCGRFLRELKMARGSVSVAADLHIRTSPALPLRGHQLGYRPKTNSYDAWTPEMWEQYIRDLIVWGVNAIELIPPRSDDAPTSPHFPLPQIEMMKVMSGLADKYGIDVWIWYPAMDKDYSDPATVEFALKEWGDVFKVLPRIDAVFVPGGDPGHTQPKYLMALLEKQTENLHKTHPNAQMWMSPQSFNQEWMDEFAGILKNEQPKWLSGLVFGPQNRSSLHELREMAPPQYKIRLYPDITHSIRSQYVVHDWDLAYVITEDREVINPRPRAEANILRVTKDDSIGFITYSEGCNDDVNKIVWSAIGWDPEANVQDILRQYARYFIGGDVEDEFAKGLLALEQNWRGPLLKNRSVYGTLKKFQAMEKKATPERLGNWRFQQALFRAYYDEYTHRRLIVETECGDAAVRILAWYWKAGGVTKILHSAEGDLARGTRTSVKPELRARIFELAEMLYQSIRMQLSVSLYKAIDVGRGAHLDLIDRPLNDREWLEAQFSAIREMKSEPERVAALNRIMHWKDPAPGGFYDDLGNPSKQPHLVRGPGPTTDPEYRQSSRVGFAVRPGYRMSWNNFAESIFDAPLQMKYEGLDPKAQYRVRLVYAGDQSSQNTPTVRLRTDDGAVIHDYMPKPFPPKVLEFSIPKESTQDGALTLMWNQEPGRGGAGRSCQVAEVWLEPVK